MPLLTAEGSEGRWRKRILNHRESRLHVGYITLWQKKVRDAAVQSSALLNTGLPLKRVPVLSPEQSFAQLLPSAAHTEVWSHSSQSPTYCTFIQRNKPFPPLQGTIPLPQTDLLAGR